jgi:DNA-directed RNA polymerase omega subunit
MTQDPLKDAKEEIGKGPTSFLIKMTNIDNVYELVVVAAQRARQINLASRILPPENGVKPVEKALTEALSKSVKYEVGEKKEKDAE